MMKRISLLLLCCTALLAASCHRQACQATRDPVDLVNPLTGTASTYQLSTGNTYPAIAMPWGMNFWTPQTGRNGDGWTYTYTANKIRGLKQTHQPSPWINDYGSFSLMPVTTGPVYDEEGRQSWFSHKAETAKPYYYKVYLADHDVTAELAPTERAAAFRLTYPQKDTSYLVVDAFEGGAVEVFRDRNMEKRYRRDRFASIGLRERPAMVLVPSDLVLVDISPTVHAANLGPIAGIEKVEYPVDSLASGNGDDVVGTAGYSIVINVVDIAGNRAQNLEHLDP